MKELSKKQILKLCIIFPILVSLFSRLLTPRMDEVYRQLNKPPLVPAPWIFSVVWLLLDILNGLALYTLLTSDNTEQEKKQGVKLFLAVYFFLFFWPIIFFEYGLVFFSFVWILALVLLNTLMIYTYWQYNKKSAAFLVPYYVWCVFAALLNLGFLIVN